MPPTPYTGNKVGIRNYLFRRNKTKMRKLKVKCVFQTATEKSGEPDTKEYLYMLLPNLAFLCRIADAIISTEVRHVL